MKTTRFAVCLALAAQTACQLRADGTFCVVADGSAAPLYMPAVTETEKFVSMDDAQAREMQRARFPKATDAELDDIVARYRDWRKWEACGARRHRRSLP